jgi:AcrR family transcriptional regulator
MSASSLRSRVRAELVDEIKAAARRRLALDGPNVTLRAVARDLGMVPSALYRYFRGRDALLTALITDGYEGLGAAAETAEAEVVRTDFRGRWSAVCRAVRQWALDHPAEYALLYGSPVPGYAAPATTVPPASRVVVALVAVLADAAAAGALRAVHDRPPEPGLRADLDRIVAQAPGAADRGRPSDHVLLAGLGAWTQLFGLVGFEVFGRLDDMFGDLRSTSSTRCRGWRTSPDCPETVGRIRSASVRREWQG